MSQVGEPHAEESRLKAHAEQVLLEVEQAGWDIDSTAWGDNAQGELCIEAWITERPGTFGNPGYSRDSLATARLIGRVHRVVAQSRVQFYDWRIDAPPRVEGRSFVGRSYARSVLAFPGDEQAVAQDLRTAREDWGGGAELPSLLGDPATTVSVFAVAGAFLVGVVGKAGEDAYAALKRAITKSRSVRKTLPASHQGEVAVLFDRDLGTVIESPREVPAEAAIQLAAMTRAQLRKRHFRWNPDTSQWDDVGELKNDQEH